MPCHPLISDPFVFPARPSNRPALPRIAYRIGRYADFVEAMTRAIDAAPELAAWTHREPDDPGIALLEGAAILGDILTFYQEHYANEAYLRTAAWRESVAELVRLTGYRLAPGIGGRATLAFEARGERPVHIAAGFAVKADLEDVAQPADLQTSADLDVWPALGRFHLYRPRRYLGTLAAQGTQFELATVDGAGDGASLAAFALKAGDRLMLVPPEPAYTHAGASLTAQQAPQVVEVKTVTRLLDRVIVETKAPLAQSWLQPVAAFKLGRSFRHLGQNAPAQTVANDVDGSGKVTGAFQQDTAFERHVDTSHDCYNTSATVPLAPTLWPLDVEVADLAVGVQVLLQAQLVAAGGSTPVPLAVVRRIRALHAGTLGFGNVSGPSTQLTLDQALVAHAVAGGSSTADVRDVRIHELTSPPLTLRPVSRPLASAFGSGTQALQFYGTAAQAKVLAGRRLHLLHDDGRSVGLVCTDTPDAFVASGAVDVARLWPLSFDRAPAPFRRADFNEAEPAVTVFGNLVDATQGKAEPDAVLGNGDARQSWQTFPLPKAPLTYFLSAGGVPPQTPELQLFVGGRVWTRVDSFFGRDAKDTVYVVREDADGRSFVQFGDGATGARLPSGVGNVVARFRTGVGARGPGKTGSTPTAPVRPPGFDKVTLAGIVSGGADPEDAGKAREAAPGKMQSLGRLVSIGDYETETLGVPGVVAAAAAWDLIGGVPAVVLRVLLEAGREAEFAAVRVTLAHAQRCRGPDRHPLVVQQALLRYAWVDLRYARDPTFRAEDVDAALRTALGLAGDTASERSGVFGLHARRLGEPEYASRIEGRAQNVDGVLWCQVAAMGLFAPGAVDPATSMLPPPPRPAAARLHCSPLELLQLAPLHLTLVAVADAAAGECA